MDTQSKARKIEEAIKWELIGFFLSDHPTEISGDEIINMIRDGNKQILIWEPLELFSRDDIADNITSLLHNIMSQIGLDLEED